MAFVESFILPSDPALRNLAQRLGQGQDQGLIDASKRESIDATDATDALGLGDRGCLTRCGWAEFPLATTGSEGLDAIAVAQSFYPMVEALARALNPDQPRPRAKVTKTH